MYVLIACVPGVGHVSMMVPVGCALRAAGHQVCFATGPDFQSQVRAAGLVAAPAGPTREAARRERLRRYPESSCVAPREQQRFHATKVWAGVYAPLMLDDLLPLVARKHPDLVAYDLATFAGPLLAELIGVPAVSHSFGPAFSSELLSEVRREVEPLWQRHNRPVPAAAGTLDGPRIEVWPKSLQLPDSSLPERVLPIRVTDAAHGESSTRPSWLAGLPDRPIVHVTLGTIFNDISILRTVVRGLRDEPINLVVTVGPDGDPDELGTQPESVLVRRWVPHAELLPHCAMVVSHAGAGTTLKTLGQGLPSVFLPQGADQFRSAEACVRAGAGRLVEPAEVTADRMREEVRVILADPAYREAASQLRKQIGASDRPAAIVPALRRLACGS